MYLILIAFMVSRFQSALPNLIFLIPLIAIDPKYLSFSGYYMSISTRLAYLLQSNGVIVCKISVELELL